MTHIQYDRIFPACAVSLHVPLSVWSGVSVFFWL